MHPPELTERNGRDVGPAHRPSRRERWRPGRSLLGFPAAVAGVWALLVAVPAVAGQLSGPEEDRGSWGDVVGAVVGNFVVVFVLALVVSGFVRLTADRAAQGARTPPEQIGAVRRVIRGGVIGGLPGLVIIGVPMLLHSAGLISADQSQFGFIGVPLLLIGTFVGILIAAADTGDSGSVMVGAAIGFVGGLAIGATTTVGIGLPGLWLVVAAAGSIAGAALSVRRGHRRTPRSRPG